MRLRSLFLAAAAVGMTASPVVAASPANPAASLSVAGNSRAATPTTENSDLMGGGFLGIGILAGIVAIVVIAIINDSEDPDSP